MDRKSILVLVICFALLLLLPKVANHLFPPKLLPPSATNQPPATATAPIASSNVTQTATSAPPTTTPAVPSKPAFVASGVEDTIVFTNENARYIFTSHGGGLKRIELVRYPETISRASKKQPQTNNLAELNAHVEVPVLAVLGGDVVQGDGNFALTRTATGVRAEKTLTNGLRIIKEFQPTTNYLVTATVRLENTASQPLNLPEQEWVVGTATPMGPDDKGMAVGFIWYNGDSDEYITGSWFDNRTLGCFPGVPRSEYRTGTSNVFWAAVHNQYFALAAMPEQPAQQIVSHPVDLPRSHDPKLPPEVKAAPPPKGYQSALVYPAVTLGAGQSLERKVHFFAGPKEYRTLARIAGRFKNNVDLVMGFHHAFGGRFSAFFARLLLLSMNGLHDLLHIGYGWVIIAITIIIKLLFWPLTLKSTRSMKRMAALQPQMKALQEKYKDDPAKLNKKMMEFWKENKVSPLGGCMPMLLQMPVFIGFFVMIQSAIELRGASFLWVPDLSKPDTLFLIPGINFPFNLLPLLMGATMLWQSHLTPPSPGMDPMQQKMMRYMPLIFLVFLYNYSSGLALYWTVQNLLSILQTKVTKTMEPVTTTAPSPLTPVSKKKK